jgi:poly-gamma-glutamate synthase PgsB/CapB
MVRLARRHKAQALVIECMALVPEYQRTENLMLIRPTHGVITNVRADHLDVMGPTVARVAFALSNTIPRNGRFFTAERGPHLESLCRSPFANRHSPVVVADPTTVTDEEMAGFTYVEHKENVALALAVCDSLAVDRGQALAGMHRSLPDSGAMRITRIADSGKTFELVNTLAANDPDSIAMLWQMVMLRKTERIVLVNCRRDRQERSKQLAGLIAGWDCAHIVATGGLPRIFVRRAVSMGVPEAKLTLMDDECPPADVYARVLNLVATDALLFATGNTVGYGSDLMAHFEAKARVSGH